METSEMKSALTQYFANIDANNIEGCGEIMAENHTYYNPVNPEPFTKETHLGLIQGLNQAFTGGQHSIINITAEGDMACVHGTWSGKHTGEFNGIPGSDNDVTFGWLNLFKFEGNQVVDEWVQFDSFGMLNQMGAIPAPAEGEAN